MYALEKNKSKLSRKFIEKKTPDYAKKQLVLCSQFLSNNSKENKQTNKSYESHTRIDFKTSNKTSKQKIRNSKTSTHNTKHTHTPLQDIYENKN